MPKTKVLLVRLGQHLYAVPIASVVEVLPDLPMEPIPNCPEFVRGVIFVRGHLIPVLSAASRLGMAARQRSAEPNIVCVRTGQRLVGIEFDEALDLIDYSLAEVLPAQEIGAPDGLFTGMFEHEGRFVRLLDPDRLASSEMKDVWMHAVP